MGLTAPLSISFQVLIFFLISLSWLIYEYTLLYIVRLLKLFVNFPTVVLAQCCALLADVSN